MSVKCQQIIDACFKQHNLSSQHSSLWQTTCMCQLAALPSPCGLPLQHSALQFFHSARKNGKLPIFEDKESIVCMLHPRGLCTHIQCKYPTSTLHGLDTQCSRDCCTLDVWCTLAWWVSTSSFTRETLPLLAASCTAFEPFCKDGDKKGMLA